MFQREHSTLYPLAIIDAVALVALYSVGVAALALVVSAVGEAQSSCATDGQDAGALWSDARRLCRWGWALHVLAWLSVAAWFFAGGHSCGPDLTDGQWSEAERKGRLGHSAADGSAPAAGNSPPQAPSLRSAGSVVSHPASRRSSRNVGRTGWAPSSPSSSSSGALGSMLSDVESMMSDVGSMMRGQIADRGWDDEGPHDDDEGP